uniref:Uncharacterized protein n=1 Tax=Micrurus carvalhoi TaxID=3147026 RepID=A0A2H6MV39_9SAUR
MRQIALNFQGRKQKEGGAHIAPCQPFLPPTLLFFVHQQLLSSFCFRNFPLRRGGRSQKRKHSQIWNQNLITCYSEGNQVCSAQHPPSADMMHHRSGHNVRPSNRIFFSQEQFQGYQRPSFQELNPHGSLQQHRNQIDKQHYWTP